MRLVDWVFTIHGMNTRGAWQEKLNWLVARSYGRALPVAIYKYGWILSGVLFRWRQRQLRDRVREQIRLLSDEAVKAGYRAKPDVIAHSFGTWLVAHALQEHKDLKVGRVILTGCILRPDFDWQTLNTNQQVEGVLNLYGTSDLPVAITHYLIPDSGPAGRRGFDSPGVINIEKRCYGHSTAFKEELDVVFKTIWTPFLQCDDPTRLQLADERRPEAKWVQSSWLLRAGVARLLTVLLLAGALALTLSALILGFARLLGVA